MANYDSEGKTDALRRRSNRMDGALAEAVTLAKLCEQLSIPESEEDARKKALERFRRKLGSAYGD